VGVAPWAGLPEAEAETWCWLVVFWRRNGEPPEYATTGTGAAIAEEEGDEVKEGVAE